MIKLNPSLATLRAFEATIRLGSMTRAARELGTTQPAVSQHIRQLEAMAGAALLNRTRQKLQPTHLGREYYDAIAAPLGQLGTAWQALRMGVNAQRGEIHISAHFGFLHQWLLPRLPALDKEFPNIYFEITPVDKNPQNEQIIPDIAIFFSSFEESRENTHRLIPECVYPICSPDFANAQGLGSYLNPEDLSEVPLLHMDQRDSRWLDWPRWLELAEFPALKKPVRFYYRNYPLLLNAAMRGRGLALGWRGLEGELLDNGNLIPLQPTISRPERGYAIKSTRPQNPTVGRVVEWLINSRGQPPAAPGNSRTLHE